MGGEFTYQPKWYQNGFDPQPSGFHRRPRCRTNPGLKTNCNQRKLRTKWTSTVSIGQIGSRDRTELVKSEWTHCASLECRLQASPTRLIRVLGDMHELERLEQLVSTGTTAFNWIFKFTFNKFGVGCNAAVARLHRPLADSNTRKQKLTAGLSRDHEF